VEFKLNQRNRRSPGLVEHESPHVHELVLVDASVLVEVQCLDELTSTRLVEPRHLHDGSQQLVDLLTF